MERIDLEGQPFDLDLVFSCGQAFRWRKRRDGVWMGVVRDKLMELSSGDGCLYWRTYPENDLKLVEDYLRLSDDVISIYEALSQSDPHLAALVEQCRGMRLLRQDPAEALLSFVCSAANSIPRIMTGIEELCTNYGQLVCEKENVCYHAFPTLEALAAADRTLLERTAGLAFRGANVQIVALQLLGRGEDWLGSLRCTHYPQAREGLLGIRGVGKKIADCVCLFALDKDDSVPVDTHVRQLAHRLFLPDLKSKSITDGVYKRVTEAFQERYGRYAGWAQQFLFYEDLLRTRALGRGLK